MDYVIILKSTKIKGTENKPDEVTENLLENVVFNTKEAADKYLTIYCNNRPGYNLIYNEYGVITGAMFLNPKRKVRIIINFDTLKVIK